MADTVAAAPLFPARGEALQPGQAVELPDFDGHPMVARLATGRSGGVAVEQLGAVVFDGEVLYSFVTMRPAPATIEVLCTDVETVLESFGPSIPRGSVLRTPLR